MQQRNAEMFDEVFDKLDQNGTGHVSAQLFEETIAQFPSSVVKRSYTVAMNLFKAKKAFLRGVGPRARRRGVKQEKPQMTMRRDEFAQLMMETTKNMSGGVKSTNSATNTVQMEIASFLKASMEQGTIARARAQLRQKWIKKMIQLSERSALNLRPVNDMLMKTIVMDAEENGAKPQISAYLGVLDRDPSGNGLRMKFLCWSQNQDALFKQLKPIHESQITLTIEVMHDQEVFEERHIFRNTRVRFFDPRKRAEYDEAEYADRVEGVCVLVPIIDEAESSYGIIGIDTLHCSDRNVFSQHEKEFYEGLAKTYNSIYLHHRQKMSMARILLRSLEYLQKAANTISKFEAYLIEDDLHGDEMVLRKVIDTNRSGGIELRLSPPRQRRTSSLFLEHLFRAALTSADTRSAIPVKGKLYEAYCVRDAKGVTQMIVNIEFDRDGIPDFERAEVTKIMSVLHETYLAIMQPDNGNGEVFSEAHIEELFNDIMLKKLEDHKQHLTVNTIAEMRSYTVPNNVIKTVINSILALIRPGKDDIGSDKEGFSTALLQSMRTYDPMRADLTDVQATLDKVWSHLDSLPIGSISRSGSRPMDYVYQWLFALVCILESRKNATKKKSSFVTLSRQ